MLYRLNGRRLAAEKGSAPFREPDGSLRQAMAAIKAQIEMASSARTRTAIRA